MKFPFTNEQFLDVFNKYNNQIFPLQLLFLLLAGFVIFTAMKETFKLQKIPIFILAFFWFWMGAIYHIRYFTRINIAAYFFGALFLFEGVLLTLYGLKKAPAFVFGKNVRSIISCLLLTYTLIIYPLIGYVNGHGYPYAPTFGLPCPTTIFSIALFMISHPRLPFYIVIIPILWSFIGFSAAFTLGIYEDTGLVVAALALLITYFIKAKPQYIKNVNT